MVIGNGTRSFGTIFSIRVVDTGFSVDPKVLLQVSDTQTVTTPRQEQE